MYEFFSSLIQTITHIVIGLLISIGLLSPIPPTTAPIAINPVITSTTTSIIEPILPQEPEENETPADPIPPEIEEPETPPEITVKPPIIENTESDVVSQTVITPIQDNNPITAIRHSTENALVNILCTTRNGRTTHVVTGSGIFVDSRGVILTNAHVAQYFLFEGRPGSQVNCVVRTGNPAAENYHATLVYISPDWIEENAQNMTTENPRGTGENDFAFLMITQPSGDTLMPDQFPFVELDIKNDLDREDSVIVAAYPAEFLNTDLLQNHLYRMSIITPIKDIYTFSGKTIDLVSIQASALARKGSSGGAVATLQGKLVGIIVTSTDNDTSEERELRAITTRHIERSFNAKMGLSITTMLSGDIASTAKEFNAYTAPRLAKLLMDALAI